MRDTPETVYSHRAAAEWFAADEANKDRFHNYSGLKLSAADRRRVQKRKLAIMRKLTAYSDHFGWRISWEPERPYDLEFTQGGGSAFVRFRTGERQYRRDLTAQERGHFSRQKKQKWTQEREATGGLMIEVKYLSRRLPHAWKDSRENEIIEAKLPEILAAMSAAIELSRKRSELHAIERRAQEANNQRIREERDRLARLGRHRSNLMEAALRSSQADYVRRYVERTETAVRRGQIECTPSDLIVWSTWALKLADELDPAPHTGEIADVVRDLEKEST